MPKNISVYIPDELVKRMNLRPEVNWSEITRKAIINYLDNRKFEEKAYDSTSKLVNKYEIIEDLLLREMSNLKQRLDELEKTIKQFLDIKIEVT